MCSGTIVVRIVCCIEFINMELAGELKGGGGKGKDGCRLGVGINYSPTKKQSFIFSTPASLMAFR
jgi:hypothetical protein